MALNKFVLVTGATGFVGTALCASMVRSGIRVVGSGRAGPKHPIDYPWIRSHQEGGLVEPRLLTECASIVHLAGRAHVLAESSSDPLGEYRRANVEGTRRLAQQAVAMGVRRFVFISSIGVHGVHTNDRPPFRHDDRPSPVEDYAISKLEAEHALHEIAEQSGLELVILRPTLVYGPGVGANFLRLLRLVDRGFPLPFGAIRSRRSLVSIDNLTHLIILCTRAPAAVGQTFLVADGEDISLPDLIRKLANGLGRSGRQVRVPHGVLLELARLAGKSGLVERLTSSLEVEIDHTRRTLDWRAPVTLDDGLEATARWYRQQGRHV